MASPEDAPPPREARYVLARTLIARERPGDVVGVVGALQGLCRALTTHLDVLGAAVNLTSGRGPAGVIAASDDRCRQLDELQFSAGEGPCYDSVLWGRPVLTPDLPAVGTGHWPGYAAGAVAAGVTGVFAFPLQVGAICLGVLDVYAARPGSLTDEGLLMTLTFARIATEILLDGDLVEGGDLAPGLGAALDYRAEIYQAQGMIMVARNVGAVEALARMRAHAFALNQPLLALALEIVGGRQRLEDE